mmetsp:Transcript_5524/g.8579  ORF Transcript_5524/g.8579 Transcript_5524/m.8579 type:complete len:87 (+) Transcript_5524:659-919(+)
MSRYSSPIYVRISASLLETLGAPTRIKPAANLQLQVPLHVEMEVMNQRQLCVMPCHVVLYFSAMHVHICDSFCMYVYIYILKKNVL